MRGLLKFFLLIFAFCLNLFSFEFPDPGQYSLFMNLKYFSDMRQIDAELISDEYFRYGNDIYKITSTSDYFVLSPSKFNDFTIYVGYFYYFNPSPKSAYCEGANTDQVIYSRNCSIEKQGVRSKIDYQDVKKITASKVATCEPNQSFDPDTQKCYRDCSKDGGINKIGLPNGGCIDCSSAKDPMAALQCICSGSGHISSKDYYRKNQVDPSASPCSLKGRCIDDEIVDFFDPSCKPDKPDDNKTKPDNNNTKPDDPNNSNQGGGNQGGNQGNNPKPNPNPGNNMNPNPDPKPNPKPGNGNSTNNDGNNNGGGGNKDTEAKFNPGDFDYSDKKREYDDFKNKYSKALDDVLKGFDGFKQGVDQFISNVQGKGLASADKHNKPTTCVKKYEIDFFGYKTSIEFDFCKVAATVSGAFYYIFYAFFFYCFLILIVKILLFAF